MPGSMVTISQNKQETRVHAEKSELLFNEVSVRAAEIGMRVNQKKTQLLCMSGSNYSNVSSYIKYDGEKINSSTSLKILGFMFGNKPNVQCHVDYIVRKTNAKLWTLRNIKKAGMHVEDMLKIYNTVIRPTFDYAAPTYHSMLTKEPS